MQTTYAKTTEDVMNYFRENYGIEMVIHNSSVCDRRVYLNDGRRADFGTRDCACGESYGCTLYDLDDNEEEEFIICESCYKDADYRI